MCPRSASAPVFIRIMLSRWSLLFSAWAFNNRFVVCAVILPTFVSVACKLDNLRSLPLVCRLRHPQISGFTFRVISRSQFNARRYFSDFSLRCVSASLLSHLKLTILASFSDTFGPLSDFIEKWIVFFQHVAPLLSVRATFWRLSSARSASASDFPELKSSPVDRDFRFRF